MALISIEGLGAPSKKTSLLGGVAQILIYPRSSSCLADVDYLFDPNLNNPNKNRTELKELQEVSMV